MTGEQRMTAWIVAIAGIVVVYPLGNITLQALGDIVVIFVLIVGVAFVVRRYERKQVQVKPPAEDLGAQMRARMFHGGKARW